MRTAEHRLTELLAECYDDANLFNSAILGKPAFWAKQREIAQSVNDYKITVAYTGNAIGKDYLVGSLVPWWLYTRTESQVIITGPSQTVLGSVTWKEIRRAATKSAVPLGMTVSEGVHGSPLRTMVRSDWGRSDTARRRLSGHQVSTTAGCLSLARKHQALMMRSTTRSTVSAFFACYLLVILFAPLGAR